MQFRQGDVFIERIDSIPSKLTRVKPDSRRRIVLAEGEATGHCHSIPRSSVHRAQRDQAGNLYLEVKERTSITHDEHDPIPLEPGTYRVRRQRSYTPEGIERVAD